ncbi:phage tail protein [Polymorphobacter arshaanensis]|uniref:phage tail protein n=1 Tax=Glacieibacterium arshaanense TaxID=2511025 RepID=UPI0014076DA6|nr:phage tail protein [Polymorphobacter arshaanensis]
MPVKEQLPSGSNFTVDLGDGSNTGFAEVVFPPFAVNPDTLVPPLLRLRRAVTGALDLYGWWDNARRDPKGGLRNVTIDLLSRDLRTSVLRWRFIKTRPVSLDYGALDANRPAIVSETLVLAFERLEMGPAPVVLPPWPRVPLSR